MTKIVHAGGGFIIQGDGQKGTESTFLALFGQSKVGKDFVRKNKIISKTDAESPDFLLNTEDGRTIGIEVVELVLRTQKVIATTRLEAIGNKIVGYFKKKGIPMIIKVSLAISSVILLST